MEAVRQPKSKTRSRPDCNPTQAPIMEEDERTVVQGKLLPNVPREEPGVELSSGEHLVEESAEDVLDTREECHSPEPEELFDVPQEETWWSTAWLYLV